MLGTEFKVLKKLPESLVHRPNDAPSAHSMVSIYGGDLEGESESSEGDVTIMSEGDSQVSSHIPTEQEQDLTSQ